MAEPQQGTAGDVADARGLEHDHARRRPARSAGRCRGPSGVTNPSSVPRHVTMAGSQIRLGRSRPRRPRGKGWNSRARSRAARISPSPLPRRRLVPARPPWTASACPVRLHLVLDAVVGQAPLERVEAAAVRRGAFAIGLQDLLQARHAARDLADGLEAQAPLVGGRLLELVPVAEPAQHLDQPRAEGVRGLDQLRLAGGCRARGPARPRCPRRPSPRAAAPRRRAEG